MLNRPLQESSEHEHSMLEGAARVSIPCGPGVGERLDSFITRSLLAQGHEVSRSRVQQWIALGAVQWCGQPLHRAYRLRGPEIVDVELLPREADSSFVPDPVPLEIVAQSSDWWVINKPAGLVVHPGAGNWRHTLMNGLLHHCPKQAELPRAGIVHRLDKDTSGLLVVARTARAQSALVAQLADRTMGRLYLAWCEGDVPAAATYDGPLGRDPRQPLKMAVRAEGRPALTQTLCLEQWGRAQRLSLLACKLHTGRTHQIRVHLSQAGFPLVGDHLYGASASMQMRAGQALHAWTLDFTDPSNETRRRFTVHPPPDLLDGHHRLGGQAWSALALDPHEVAQRFKPLAS
jgi:23S rRNA pseudouridine1911/1915/1917 synthase